jgi:integrase
VLPFFVGLTKKLPLWGSVYYPQDKIVGVLKSVFKEGIFHETLTRDPTQGIGMVKHTPKARGIFTLEELKKLFPEASLGPWASLHDYCAFLLTASTGMRRGEVLALRRGCVRDDHVEIVETWKGLDELGAPKSGKARVTPFILFPDLVRSRLGELRVDE